MSDITETDGRILVGIIAVLVFALTVATSQCAYNSGRLDGMRCGATPCSEVSR